MSKVPNSAPYADTTLIDCSRDTSEEVRGGLTGVDTALWTNKIGTGLKLNPGDKVSIASAFVSDKGCGGDVIEFRGEIISDSGYTLRKTVLVPEQPPVFNTQGTVGTRQTQVDEDPPLPFGQCQPYNAHRMTHQRVQETFQVQDNQAHLEISYFKSVNGDGYFHLPRRWDLTRHQNGPGVTRTQGTAGSIATNVWEPYRPYWRAWNHLGYWGNPTSAVGAGASTGAFTPERPYVPSDDLNPLPYYDCPLNGRIQGIVSHPSIAMDDWYHFNEDYSFLPHILAAPAALQHGDKEAGQPSTGMPTGVDTGSIGYRKRNNNDRYTIYAKDVCFFSHYLANRLPDPVAPVVPVNQDHEAQTAQDMIYVNPPDDITLPASFPTIEEDGTDSFPYASRNDFISTANPGMTSTREPACSGYTKYTEIKSLNVPVGYNAPANVASTMTDQLNSMDQPKKVIGWTGSWLQEPNYQGARTNVQAQVIVSQTTSAETFKPFCCANLQTFSYDNYTHYFTANVVPYPGVEGTQNNRFGELNGHDVVNYLSSYQYIGVKRPELFDAIRSYYYDQVSQAGLNLTWRTLQHSNVTSTHPIPAAGHFDTSPVVTNVPWTTANLDKMNDIFKVQELYPELFNNYHHTNIGINPDVNGHPITIVFYLGARADLNQWSFDDITYEGFTVDDDNRTIIIHRTLPLGQNSVTMFCRNTNAALSPGWAVRPATVLPAEAFIYYGHLSTTEISADLLLTSGAPPMAVPVPGVPCQLPVAVFGTTNNKFPGQQLSPSNARFIHMNPWEDTQPPSSPLFAVSGSQEVGSDLRGDEFSCPLFMYCDELRTLEANGGEVQDNLYYGTMLRRSAVGGPPVPGDEFIAFTTDYIGGMGRYLLTTAIPGLAGRGIGWDIHFSAFGTSCIGLYSGLMGAGKTGNQQQQVKQTGFMGATGDAINGPTMNNQDSSLTYPPMDVSQFLRQRYIGANNPLIAFDTTGSRFNFQQLHTSMFTGNEPQAGGISITGNNGRYNAVLPGPPATGPLPPSSDDVVDVPSVPDAGDKVLFINRRLKGNEYCPDMCPYNTTMTELTVQGLTRKEIDVMNHNLEPYSICDADSGIFLENFGVSQTHFPNSLWGVLGFTWEQFNSVSTYSRQTRLTDLVTTDQIAKPTTNANIAPVDLAQLTANVYGNSLYQFNLPCPVGPGGTFPSSERGGDNITSGTRAQLIVDIGISGESRLRPNEPAAIYPNEYSSPPAVTIKQTSCEIAAKELPRKMLSAYFLIKSNIIGDVSYLGGPDSGQALAIVGICNKENGFGDFYFSSTQDLVFTITRPVTLSEITTSIHNPTMELAQISGHSSVIYKVVKMNSANLNVVQQVLSQGKK